MKYALVMIGSSWISTRLCELWILCSLTWRKGALLASLRQHFTSARRVKILLTNQLHLLVPGQCARYLNRGVTKKKRVQYGAVLLVPSTAFHNGNTKITVLMCNVLSWAEPDCLVETQLETLHWDERGGRKVVSVAFSERNTHSLLIRTDFSRKFWFATSYGWRLHPSNYFHTKISNKKLYSNSIDAFLSFRRRRTTKEGLTPPL